ncbi:family 78 glycoside hydrolase catalytic domain [Agrilactobacillus yilanensis]|uniref:alpha-L-rhamnosidase n=1 Tax=Agrilactobacillus yilanensis TaxID=2485997 RepID=A0ABW4J8G3_9LACO|nr:alpha-L-rhamnosidase [Agrilactobacillus yilanensis]
MLKVENLNCNDAKNVIGIVDPTFSWKIKSDTNNVIQKTFHLQMAVDKDFDKIIWNYSEISKKSTHIPYKGAALVAATKYFVRVKVTTTQEVSDWSETIYFETPISDWQGTWITPKQTEVVTVNGKTYHRPFIAKKLFELKSDIKKARLYISALGVYEARLNQHKVGSDYLRPGFTDYDHHVQFQSYDVTDMLKASENDLSIQVGEGWYSGYLGWHGDRDVYGNCNAVIAQLVIWTLDNQKIVISTDQDWCLDYSNVVMSDIYDGEYYDEYLETPTNGKFVTFKRTKASLVPQEGPAVQQIKTIKPVAIFKDPAGNTVLDMGQNMVGWVQFQNINNIGKIELAYGEVLDQAGNFYNANLRSAAATDTFVIQPNNRKRYEPHFTYHGFRYVRLSGFSDAVTAAQFLGIAISSATAKTGIFETANKEINQLQSNIEWSQLDNFVDIPTDCPQRDERQGWTADAQIFAKTATFNRNVNRFFWKWLTDLTIDQKLQNGSVPVIIPDIINGLFGDGLSDTTAAWGDAATIIPWTLYQAYGDLAILNRQYDSMKTWVDYIRSQGSNEVLWNTGLQLADWVGLDSTEDSYYGATDGALAATAYYAYSTKILAKSAKLLRKMSDYNEYRDLYQRIKAAFQANYLPDGVHPITNTQTANILILEFELAQKENVAAIADNLVALLAKNNDHLNTGFLGTPYLCHVLTETGHGDLAYKLLFNDDFPSWLYQVKHGATTVWEHWDGIKVDGSFWSDDMNSFNHYAYGSIGAWLYAYVGGLSQLRPGFEKSMIAPLPNQKIGHCQCQLETSYGSLACTWQLEASELKMTVTIPANTTAVVVLPNVKDKAAVIEQVNQVTNQCADFKFQEKQQQTYTFMNGPEFEIFDEVDEKVAVIPEDAVGFEIGSGHYQFSYTSTMN